VCRKLVSGGPSQLVAGLVATGTRPLRDRDRYSAAVAKFRS
jgi:hypothetical protein